MILFCSMLEQDNVSMVYEFYADLPDIHEEKVYVRGVRVPFTTNSINELLQCPPLEAYSDGYYQWLKNPDGVDYEDVVNTLCFHMAEWNMSGSLPRSIVSCQLNKAARFWAFFMCARFLLVSHVSDMMKEKTLMIYALMTSKSFNVG